MTIFAGGLVGRDRGVWRPLGSIGGYCAAGGEGLGGRCRRRDSLPNAGGQTGFARLSAAIDAIREHEAWTQLGNARYEREEWTRPSDHEKARREAPATPTPLRPGSSLQKPGRASRAIGMVEAARTADTVMASLLKLTILTLSTRQTPKPPRSISEFEAPHRVRARTDRREVSRLRGACDAAFAIILCSFLALGVFVSGRVFAHPCSRQPAA